MKKFIYIFLFFNVLVNAQTGNLKGRVTENGEPLPSVNIILMQTNFGAASNENGYFRLQNIPEGSYKVKFSSIGFESKIIEVKIESGRTTELNVTLEDKTIEVDQVEVVASKIQKQSDTRSSLVNLEPKETTIMPGAVTDVFRSLQALPGVLSPNDFSSQLIIRGSGPDQNLIIMDDVEVFNPYRLYGVVSMFNPEAVSDINLMTGGFPAKYGDRLSAVLDVTNKQGTKNEYFAGNLDASIVSANAVFEGKNPFGIDGSWLINSRRTYYDLIVEPFVKNSGLVEDNVSFPNFYDIQTKIAFGPFNGNKFFINGIFSRDGVQVVSGPDRESPDSLGVRDLTKNDLASFAWHYAPSDRLLNKVILSWYRNGGDSEFDSKFLDPTLNREQFEEVSPDTLDPYLFNFGFDSEYIFRKYTISDKLYYFWGENNELQMGAGVDFMKTLIDFDFSLDPKLEAFLLSSSNFRSTISDVGDLKNYSRYHFYIQNNFGIGEKVFIDPGLRYDYYDILDKGYLSPRLSVSYALDDLTTLRASWGYYYQSPGYEKLRDGRYLYDFSKEYLRDVEAEQSVHYILSGEKWLNNKWKATLSGYYKDFKNLMIPKVVGGTSYYTERVPGKDPRFESGWTNPVPVASDSTTQIPTNNAYGEAYGLELKLEKRNIEAGDKISGWISYALAYTNRIEQGYKLPFRFDQRHTLNLVLNYEVNDWMRVGARFRYGSGFPITKPKGIKPRIIMQDTDLDGVPETPELFTRQDPESGREEVVYNVDFGGIENRYSGRKPDYHRLDIRVSFFADYFDLDWTFYLDIINIYNNANVVGYDYYVEDLELKSEKTTMLPIFPTLGFRVAF